MSDAEPAAAASSASASKALVSPSDSGTLDLAAIVDSIDQMIWSARPDGFHDFYNARWYAFTGVPVGSTDGEAWAGMFHPDDQARTWEIWRHSLETGERYHIEYRLRHSSGAYRWVIGRAQPVRDASGRILRWYGTCTDIHDLKMAEAARDLIAQELSHRIKNTFALIGGLVAMSARDEPASRPFAQAIQARIAALADAHDFIRPAGLARPGTVRTLRGLIDIVLKPYKAGTGTRVEIGGDDAAIGESGATAMALLLHELATNAVKHGALSSEAGEVGLTCRLAHGTVTLIWEERGGPAVDGPPDRRGFGLSLSERVAHRQLGAEIAHDWQREGLVVTVVVDADRLGA